MRTSVGPLDPTPPPRRPTLGGGWTLRPVDPEADAPLLESWLGAPHAIRYRTPPHSREQLREALRTQLAGRASRPFVASIEGDPVIYLELHRVLCHPLRGCYPVGAHDLAVWLTVGECARTGRGLASRLLRELVPALFTADPRCRRIVAAPTQENTSAQRAFAAGGFRRVAEADLPGSTVVLLAAEPPQIAGLPTALDDMPH